MTSRINISPRFVFFLRPSWLLFTAVSFALFSFSLNLSNLNAQTRSNGRDLVLAASGTASANRSNWSLFRTPIDDAINTSTLWYNGDFAMVSPNPAITNGVSFAGTDGRVYVDFNVTSATGWDVNSVFSNNIISVTGITQASYEIRSGVSVGNGGTLLFSGTAAATQTATGRTFSTFNEYTIRVSGLNIHLGPGTYWLNVAPVGSGTGFSANSATAGANAVGSPAGNNGNEFWKSGSSNYTSLTGQGFGDDHSDGITGNVTVPCGSQSTVYVDDNWIGTPTGDDPDGAGPATNFGCNSFATVQGGVNGVATGGTVNVASGTYNESQVLITRSMTVTGAGAATTTINGGNATLTAAGIVRIVTLLGDTGTTTFSGFTVTNPGLSPETSPTHVAIYARPLDAAATTRITNTTILGVHASDNGFYSIRNLGTVEFDHNIITNTGFNPIVIERSEGPTNVHHSSFTANFSTAYFNFTYANTNVTFQQRVADNTVDDTNAGGIVFNSAYPAAPPFIGTFTNVVIANNTITNVVASRESITVQNRAAVGNGPAGQISGVSITGNKILGNDGAGSRGIRIAGQVIGTTITNNDVRHVERGFSGESFNSHSPSGIQAHFNNFVNNAGGFVWDLAAAFDAENNWWGCNAGPGGAGCDAINGAGAANVDFDPWMVLQGSASPNSILPLGSSTVTADLTHNSAGVIPAGILPDQPVSFSATNGSMLPTSGTITAGTANSTFVSSNNNSAVVTITVQNQAVQVPILVQTQDLTAVKTNNAGGIRALNSPWNWTITVTNSGTVNAVFGSGTTVFTDSLPNSNITYGAPTTTANATCAINGSFDLTCTASAGGVTVGPGGSFTITVPVNGASVAGTYVNPRSGGMCVVDPAGQVPEINEGNNTCSNTVQVFAAPTVTKSFGAATIGRNGTTTLTINITNPAGNPAMLSGLSFTDTFPAGLVVAGTPGTSNTCNGAVTAVAGANNFSLSNGSIAAAGASCAVTVSVRGASSGIKANTVTVDSAEGGTSSPASATLTVVDPGLDFDGDGVADYAVVRNTGGPIADGLASPPRDITLGAVVRGRYFRLPGEKFDPLMPRLERADGTLPNGMRWLIHTSGPGADLNIVFGTVDDFPVPADYDGDGLCDLAGWNSTTGQFKVLTSSSGFVTTVTYSLGNTASDPSIVGDYDGDGLADPAVYSASTGQFSYLGGPTHSVLTTVFPVGTFGGGFPIPGDYDGDGKFDFMLETRDGLNQTQGHFYEWLNNGSTTPPATTNFVFGNYRDVIVPADFDGDGITDVGLASVIVNPIAWRVRLTPSGTMLGPVSFGDPNVDYTIGGDYNGDHKGDLTIWHSPGLFQTLFAPGYNAPTTDFSWGQSGDYPVAYFNSH
jgi:hypothetical protein